jgi:membrane-associated phospholipid phosphatase
VKNFICLTVAALHVGLIFGQSKIDSVQNSSLYQLHSFDGQTYAWRKPKNFQFITQIPRAFAVTGRDIFARKSLLAISVIAGSTLILIPADQYLTDHAQQFGRFIHLDSKKDYKTLISFRLGKKQVPVYELPRNLNSAFYSLGEGFSSMLVTGAMFGYGKIKNDHRALQTASQILQSQLMVGVATQTLKRITGRESPFRATAPGGVWRPFPGFGTFTNNTSKYDAFPSGHLASMTATLTILASNFPEKKWISITAYSLIGVVGFAMVNNGVHWASDYPLALGIGYVCGKATVKMNRILKYEHTGRNTLRKYHSVR